MFIKKRRVGKFRFSQNKNSALSKDLSKQRHSNKLIKKTGSTLSKIKKIIFALFILVGIVFAVNSIFFTNYFQINEIKISDNNIENNTIGEKITASMESALGKNIIFLDTDNFKEKILDEFPEIENVEIKKSYPKRIIIEFSEFPLAANVINESTTVKKTYIINSIGYAVKENMENPNLPYIRVKSDEPLNVQTAVIEANKLNYIIQSKIYFEEKFGMRIIEANYKTTAREVHLLTEKNFYIRLDMQIPAEIQLKKLKKALVKLDIYNENLEYIDLRIAGENGDKIIYKRK